MKEYSGHPNQLPTIKQITGTNIAYKKYGITPSTLRYMVNNNFYFPERYKDCLKFYRMSQISTSLFLSILNEGMIIPEGEKGTYQVIYHNTDPTKLKRRAAYTSVKLSFRVADPIFGIFPTVLVKEVKEIKEVKET